MRIGHGYDVHRMIKNRPLVLGGVTIPYSLGLLGHSDADVLVHAIMDALLGAAGLPDIGQQFPDRDPAYKGISSMLLLGRVMELLQNAGWKVESVDTTVIAEKPKLAPYMPAIKAALSAALGTPAVNVKATTEEGLGFTGEGQGIAAHAVVLLEERL
ncbi:MAG: 2-C-methyl-D-erythritol 2,4-cyclodiphosphate synthase [Clostridiaceae bacterium]|nr:2-C-methyl-D-erythritol 2,4-cyclodiphosphate synthase [Clostridiaceae bacterium]